MTSAAAQTGGPPGGASRERLGLWAPCIFTVALLVRVAHVLQIRGADFFALTLGDTWAFEQWARQIAGGDWLGDEVFWYAPLYPYFLGAFYATIGDDPLVVRLCQASIGAASCVLLAWAGRRWFSKPVGVAAGFILALYAPAVFYDGLLHKPVLVLLLLCLLLGVLGGLARHPGRPLAWLWAGASLGGLILTRENAMAFAPVLLLWLFLQRRVPVTRRLACACLLAIGLALMLVPVCVRNKVVGGEFHVTAANFGDNFYKGNNPRADGTYMPLRQGRGTPKYERHDATAMAEEALGRKLAPSEVSRYWTGRALEYIRSDPGDWLLLMANKCLLFWNDVEWSDSEDQYTHADWSAPLRYLGLVAHFGVLAPLAACGLWITWARRRGIWLLYLMMASYTASVLLFYIFGRYRYPITPFLALFAAAALVEAAPWLRARSLPAVVGCVATAIAAAVFCNWHVVPTDNMRAVTASNIGNELSLAKRPEKAIEAYRRAVTFDPDYAPAHVNLGIALKSQDRLDEAIRAYRQALVLRPNHAGTRINLGVALAEHGQHDEAEYQFLMVLQRQANRHAALTNLSKLYKLQGRSGQAIRYAEQAARSTGYADAQSLVRLESSYVAASDFERAAEVARRLLDLADASGNRKMADSVRARLETYLRRNDEKSVAPDVE